MFGSFIRSFIRFFICFFICFVIGYCAGLPRDCSSNLCTTRVAIRGGQRLHGTRGEEQTVQSTLHAHADMGNISRR